jgi:hypothetical protein
MKGYTHDKTRWRFCNHPRTPANTAASGRGFTTCRTCKLARDKQRWANGPSLERKHRLPVSRSLAPIVFAAWKSLPIQDHSGRSYSLGGERKG